MNLITDRTESDALLRNEKGIYGYTDLNRVETAVGEISEYFPTLGIGLDLRIKTDWGMPGSFSVEEWPVASQMQRYIDNVRAIKNAFSISLALPPTMGKLTWRNANNIEKVLASAAERAANMVQIFRYSGEIYSGEE